MSFAPALPVVCEAGDALTGTATTLNGIDFRGVFSRSGLSNGCVSMVSFCAETSFCGVLVALVSFAALPSAVVSLYCSLEVEVGLEFSSSSDITPKSSVSLGESGPVSF